MQGVIILIVLIVLGCVSLGIFVVVIAVGQRRARKRAYERAVQVKLRGAFESRVPLESLPKLPDLSKLDPLKTNFDKQLKDLNAHFPQTYRKRADLNGEMSKSNADWVRRHPIGYKDGSIQEWKPLDSIEHRPESDLSDFHFDEVQRNLRELDSLRQDLQALRDSEQTALERAQRNAVQHQLARLEDALHELQERAQAGPPTDADLFLRELIESEYNGTASPILRALTEKQRTRLEQPVVVPAISRAARGMQPAAEFYSDAPLVSNQSGGVDVRGENVTIGQDVVGRDKIVYYYASSTAHSQVRRQRRVESYLQAYPAIGQTTSLFVQIKLPESPLSSPDAQTRNLAMPFQADAQNGAALPTTFKIKVIAPGFQIFGRDEKELCVLPDEDSPVAEFQLQCNVEQRVKIQVEVYAESGLLGQVNLPVAVMPGEAIPASSAGLWVCGVIVLGALPNTTVSVSW
jgi:hypothetical protein